MNNTPSRDGDGQPTQESPAEMADDPTPGDEPEPTPTPEPETEPEPETPEVPDEVKSVLDKERKAAREAARKAKAAETALAKATKELEQFRDAQLTEQEKAVKAARDEGLSEGRAAGNARLLRAEVIAAASGKLANPAHAFAILTDNGALKGIEVNEDGAVDTNAIQSAIDDLVKAEPHLSAVRDPEFGNRQPAAGSAATTDEAFDAFLRAHRR